MEVRIHDVGLSIANKHEEMKLVKNIKGLEMYKDIEFGGFIIIDGKTYRHCMYNIEKDILGVKLVNFNEKGNEIEYSSDFICPYCGNVDHDAFELGDGGETECGACGSDLEYEREITVEYNIKPKKCAPVTVV